MVTQYLFCFTNFSLENVIFFFVLHILIFCFMYSVAINIGFYHTRCFFKTGRKKKCVRL